MVIHREKGDAISPTQFLLLLHSVPQIGEKALARLLRLHSQNRLSPEEFLSLEAQTLIERYELQTVAAEYLSENRSALLLQSSELARTLRLSEIQLLSIESASYPKALDRYDDAPPPLIYTRGNQSLLALCLPKREEEADAVEQTQRSNQSGYSAGIGSAHFTYTIAVSNGASAETLSKLESISINLVTQGGVPVTGHDRSPYKLLALTAQRQNSPTFYVFDRGLREALGPRFDRPPFTAARIRDAEFNASRDLALSCFRIDDHSIGANNRRRDRLIFSLSQKIVALEVRAGGTMFSECLRAFRQGRSVFVTESDQDGNRSLIEQGCPIFSSLR